MAFYQNTVLNKHLKALNSEKIHAAYAQFKVHFHNPEVQQNIRASKEEQYQEGFLRDLFVNILGYKLNPNAEFNLTTEYKNVKDSKKADGAIIISPSTRGHAPLVSAIIELKGTETTDLDKVEPQAFGYKNNQPECTYIVISNFEKLRFYIDNAIEHIEFNLFTLTLKEFELLWVCLAYESIAADLPKKIKNASISEEDSITKNLYKDYSLFKRELHQNLVALNPEMDELLLFKKSQKLLDRFLFLLFAEDRQLLPPNSVREILKQWNDLKDLDAYTPLYSRFKLYFGYLNTGHKGKHHDIFAYNGGLFKPDDVLDVVQIDDELLYRHTLKLSDYDFASEVDVNILGHIFENSLNELDELSAAAAGQEFDKSKTKRKRDGVVYTPKYITKYIVENTVGKLCEEKQAELGLKDEDYSADKKQNKTAKKLLFDKLTAYREWLLQITICDPACGSGAFLVEALDFLIREHRYIDELQAKLFGDTLVLSDVEKSILENNLFGVDINEESVEIAKLSLWLRTAQPNRKLNDLNNNIKCGNSLIDDPTVAGDKAFNWEKEFPQVFGVSAEMEARIIEEIPQTPDYLQLIKEKSLEAQQKAEQGIALSKEALEITKQLTEYADKLKAVSAPEAEYQIGNKGFDVVIGNPPYVNIYNMRSLDRDYFNLSKSYKTTHLKYDLYVLFIEKGISILKRNGHISYIIPSVIMSVPYGTLIRKKIIEENTLTQIVDFTGFRVFADVMVEVCILVITKKKSDNNLVKIFKPKLKISDFQDCYFEINQNEFTKTESFQFRLDLNDSSIQITKKIKEKSVLFESIYYVSKGIVAFSKIDGRKKDDFLFAEKVNDKCVPYLEGKDVSRYYIDFDKKYLEYDINIMSRPTFPELHNKNKILIRAISDGLNATYDNEGYYIDQKLIICSKRVEIEDYIVPAKRPKSAHLNKNNEINDLAILALINSKLSTYYYLIMLKGGVSILPEDIRNFPIFLFDNAEQQEPFVSEASKILLLTKQLNAVSQKFQRMLQRKFDLEELPVKLQNWYTLTYKDFVTELGKKKIKFTLAQEAEWEDYFAAEQTKALEIKNQIESTDREIDRMVYELYELTEEEIKIVEGSGVK